MNDQLFALELMLSAAVWPPLGVWPANNFEATIGS